MKTEIKTEKFKSCRMGRMMPLFGFLLLFSCVQEFDYVNRTGEKHLVIDGGIDQVSGIQQLKLHLTNDYGGFAEQPVVNAEIILFDDTGESEYYVPADNGLYYLMGSSLDIKTGRTYYIEIRRPGDRIYRSVPQKMPEVVVPDSLNFAVEKSSILNEYGVVVDTYHLNVYLNTPMNRHGPDYFIWRSEQIYSLTEVKWNSLVNPKTCYAKESIDSDQLYIFSGENIQDEYLSDMLVCSVWIFPDWQFFEKHFYNIAQHTITAEAYEYWKKVNQIAYPTGSIFDTPPAPVPGNIYNVNDPEEIVLGFFEVSAVDTIRTWTNREKLKPLAISDRCNDEYLYLSWNDPVCRTCQILDHSFTERPYYWGND